MPAASTTTAQDVSTELGKSTTTALELNWANTRNVACKSSSTISLADCRWGINFRGGEFTSGAYTRLYGTKPDLVGYAYDSDVAPGSASSTAQFTLRANGQMTVEIIEGAFSVKYNSTWLTSGVNSDYTAQVTVTSGSWSSGTTATDLALSTDRTWTRDATRSTNGITTNQVVGNLIIKDTGGTLITRPYDFTASAELSI